MHKEIVVYFGLDVIPIFIPYRNHGLELRNITPRRNFVLHMNAAVELNRFLKSRCTFKNCELFWASCCR